jgi:hypothetical protein
MKYLLFGGLALAGAFGLPYEVAAVEVTIGQAKIELVGPRNFCLLDKKNSLDSQVLDITQRTIQGRNELLAMFADCTRLAAWHDGKADDLGDTFDFQVSLKAKNMNATKAAVTDICGALRKQAAEISKTAEGLAASNVKAIKELAQKVEFNSLKIYGVLHEDDTGCYSGSVLTMKVEDRVEVLFNVGAVTVVKSRLVFANHGGDTKDETGAKRLLATSRETVAAFRARNP